MEISLVTDIGQKRSNNQDFIGHYSNQSAISLIILADGMGGHKAGNIASQLAVTDLGEAWTQTDLTEIAAIQDWLEAIIQKENQKLFHLGQTDTYKGMGTTIEALVIVKETLLYAHVGDSRVALIRQASYHQLTKDHSLVNALLEAGQITEDEAKTHPQRNVITQSIGQERPLAIDFGVHDLEQGDLILAASDGLTNMVSDAMILETLLDQKLSLEEKAKQLVTLANQAGGMDNITVALLAFLKEGLG